MTSCLKNKTMHTLPGIGLVMLGLMFFAIMNLGDAFAREKCSPKGQGFNSPQDAVTAIVAAARELDCVKTLAILGADAEDIIFSGDRVAGQGGAVDFVEKYDAKHHLEMVSPTSSTLVIGETDWPFPIPVVKVGDKWFFDVATGKEEILCCRIGENELEVIQVMQAYVEAQLEYASLDRDDDGVREFAQQLMSDEGKKNGLHWPVEEGEKLSPLGPLIAEVRCEGYDVNSGEPQPYHGYLYKIFTRQGERAPGGAYDYVVNGNMILGFGLFAYPARYGTSGIMTFAVNQEGVVYEIDLGEKTAEIAARKVKYDLDKTWQKVSDQDLGND